MSDQAKRQYDEMQEGFRQQQLGERGISTGGHSSNQRGLDDYYARQAQEENRRETARELERAQKQQREADARAARNREQQAKQQEKQTRVKPRAPKSADNKGGLDVLIGLAGAGGGVFFANESGATEFLHYAVAAAIAGGITYAMSGLIKVLLAVAVAGGVIYLIATSQG